MRKNAKEQTQAKRVVGDGNVDTWEEIKELPVRPNRISRVTRSFIESWSRFLNSTPPTMAELEAKSGMSAGEIMARSASHS